LLKFVLPLAGVIALMVWLGSTALADGGPHRGALFGAKPDYCAACHRVHTGKAPKLLKESSQENLCYTCHGNTATGADTNVYGGRYAAQQDGTARVSAWEEAPKSAAGGGLKGGGFAYAYMDTDLDSSPTSAAVTSSHKGTYTGADWGDRTYVTGSHGLWGGGTDDVAAVSITDFQCGSCHNPHGNSNYRMLRGTPRGMPSEATATPVNLPDEGREYLYGNTGVASANLTITTGTEGNATDDATGNTDRDNTLNNTVAEITGWAAVDDSYTYTSVDDPLAATEAAYVEFYFYVSGYIDDELRLEYSEDGTWSTVYTLKTYTAADPPPTSLSLVSYAPTSGTLNSSTKLTNAQLRLRLSVVNGGAGDGFTVYLGAARIASKTVVETLYATAQSALAADGTTDITPASSASIDQEFDGETASVTAVFTDSDAKWEFTNMSPTATGQYAEYVEVRFCVDSSTNPITVSGEELLIKVDDGTGAYAGVMKTYTSTSAPPLCPGAQAADLAVVRWSASSLLNDNNKVNSAKVKFTGNTANATNAAFTIVVDEVRIVTGTKVYTVTYDGNNYRDTSYAPPKISEWCSQCHTKYLVASGQEEARATNTNFQYRHMTQGLSGGCLKCHVAHGTIAAMGTYSNQVTYPDANAAEATTRSRLLHVDNRGVCMQCHSAITSD
jgi:predicted CXXCH cytochrome family protein